jgi:hypothetical protein
LSPSAENNGGATLGHLSLSAMINACKAVVSERVQVSVTLLTLIQMMDADFGRDTGYRGLPQTLQANEGATASSQKACNLSITVHSTLYRRANDSVLKLTGNKTDVSMLESLSEHRLHDSLRALL